MSATRSAARPFGLLTLGLRTALSGSSWIVLDRPGSTGSTGSTLPQPAGRSRTCRAAQPLLRQRPVSSATQPTQRIAAGRPSREPPAPFLRRCWPLSQSHLPSMGPRSPSQIPVDARGTPVDRSTRSTVDYCTRYSRVQQQLLLLGYMIYMIYL